MTDYHDARYSWLPSDPIPQPECLDDGAPLVLVDGRWWCPACGGRYRSAWRWRHSDLPPELHVTYDVPRMPRP